jgi:hypothetical protein
MKQTRRRDRTDLWAWTYLAIFGAGEAEEGEAESTVAADGAGGRDDVPPSRGE